MHVFELGPKIFEMHVFSCFYTFLHDFENLVAEPTTCRGIHDFELACSNDLLAL